MPRNWQPRRGRSSSTGTGDVSPVAPEVERRNLERRTRGARLGSVTTMDRFDWSHPRTIDRPLVERLLTLDFVDAAENVLFRGPSGVGKTTLARNLGRSRVACPCSSFRWSRR